MQQGIFFFYGDAPVFCIFKCHLQAGLEASLRAEIQDRIKVL